MNNTTNSINALKKEQDSANREELAFAKLAYATLNLLVLKSQILY